MGHLVANSLIIIKVLGLFENNGPIKFMWKLRHAGYNHQVMHNMVNEDLLKIRDLQQIDILEVLQTALSLSVYLSHPEIHHKVNAFATCRWFATCNYRHRTYLGHRTAAHLRGETWRCWVGYGWYLPEV